MSVAVLRNILRGWSSGEDNWDTGGMDANLQYLGNHLGFVVAAVDHTVGAPASPSSLVANPREGDAVIHVPSGAYSVWTTGEKLQAPAWKAYSGKQGLMGFQSVGAGFMIWANGGSAWLDMTATGFVNTQLLALALQSYLKRDGTTAMTAELPLSGAATQPNSAVTLAQVQSLITNLVNGAPGVLDQLSEISAALNSDPAFGTHMLQQIAAANANANDRVSKTETAAQTMAGDLNNPNHLISDKIKKTWIVPAGVYPSGYRKLFQIAYQQSHSTACIFGITGTSSGSVFSALYTMHATRYGGGSLTQISGSSSGLVPGHAKLRLYDFGGFCQVYADVNGSTADTAVEITAIVFGTTEFVPETVFSPESNVAAAGGQLVVSLLTTPTAGGGGSQVIHNATLTGDGTAASPLGVVAPAVTQQTWQGRTAARLARGVTYTNTSALPRACWTDFTISGQAVLGWFAGTVHGINVDNTNGAAMTNRPFILDPGASVAFAIWDGGVGSVDAGRHWLEYDV